MSEQPDHLILVYLRRLDEKLDRVIDMLEIPRPTAVMLALGASIHDFLAAGKVVDTRIRWHDCRRDCRDDPAEP
ncbi:MAG: hypothetical protein ACREF1_08605 [Acetobacteraceae bacterium]